jgi:hypothetical protein
VEALTGLPEVCAMAVKQEGLEPEGKYLAFIAVLDRDSRDSLAAIEVVLAQSAISSQLIDNLNASIHLRALLTDLFLLGEILRKQTSGGGSHERRRLKKSAFPAARNTICLSRPRIETKPHAVGQRDGAKCCPHEGQLGTDPTDGNLLFPPSGGSRAEKHEQES